MKTPNKNESKVFLTAKEAADFLGITPKYIYQLTHQHLIPYYAPMGRRILFKRSELLDMIENSRVSTNAELLSKVHGAADNSIMDLL